MDFCWQEWKWESLYINNVTSSGKSFILILNGKVGLSKESETFLNSISMISLYNPILFKGVRTWELMNDSKNWKWWSKRTKFSTPTYSKTFQFAIKMKFSLCFEIIKSWIHFRFSFKEVKSYESEICIYKTHRIMKNIGWEGGGRPQRRTSELISINRVWYVEYEIWQGNLRLFPNWQAVQNENSYFLKIFFYINPEQFWQSYQLDG